MAFIEDANTEKKTQTFIDSVVFQSGFTIESDAEFSVGSGSGSSASTTDSELVAWNGISVPDTDFGVDVGGTIRLNGAAPSSPRNGDIWVASNQIKVRTDGLTKGIVGINKLGEFRAQNNEAPTSNPATLYVFNNHWLLAFDAATDESAVFSSVMPESYSGGNLYVDIFWLSEGEFEGDVVWNAAFETLVNQDLSVDGFAAVQAAAAATTNDPQGVITKTTITFTQAQADGISATNGYRVKITRDANNGSDTMAGDALVKFVQVRGE